MDVGKHTDKGWLWCCLLVLFFSASGAFAQSPAPSAPDTLRVVTDNNYPPYVFLDADGKPQGYEVDMWRLFEKYTGTKVALTATFWESAQQRIQSGNADVIGMMFRSPSREALYEFSKPYATLPVGIYVESSLSGVRDIAALRELPVGVEAGDACAEILVSKGVTHLRLYPQYQDIVTAALDGDLRVFCMDENPANYFLYRNDALDRFSLAFVLYEGQFHHAVRKGNTALLQKIEAGMAKIPADELEALQAKWLKHPYILQPWLQAAKIATIIALAIVLLLALWIWSLGRSVRKRTAELHEQQNKLRTLFDASPDAMWVKDSTRAYLDCNDRALQMFRVERSVLLGQRDEDLFPEYAEAARASDLRVLRNRSNDSYMATSINDAGETRHIELVKTPLLNTDGSVHGLLCVARDITGRLENEEKLRLWAHAFEHAGFGVEICDLRTNRITAVNPTFAHERGYTPEEMVGMPISALYPDAETAASTTAMKVSRMQEHILLETTHITRDGKPFPVQLDCSVFYDTDGTPRNALIYAQDISPRKQTETELRLAAVAFETRDSMMVLDADGNIQRINSAFTTLTGFAANDILGKQLSILSGKYQDQNAYPRTWMQIRRDGYWQGEKMIDTRGGQPRVVRMEVSAVNDDTGKTSHYVCALTDLTSEREAHARAEHMRFFDPLTDLPNRNFLQTRMHYLLEDSDSHGGALLMIDIDHFKRINDLRGHAIGDRLLSNMVKRLRLLLGGDDILCRLSGGSFTLLTSCPAPDSASCNSHTENLAQSIQQALQEPFQWDDITPISITVSIGWTQFVSGRDSLDGILKEAELAMYAAKSAGRNQICRFQPAMLSALEKQEALAGELLSALTEENSGLDLHLQLQVDRQGLPTGAEALLRWSLPSGEQVSPGVFIALAEDSGLILPLGDWVLQRVCSQLARWAEHPLTRDLVLAANVSAKQFAQPAFVEDVRQALQRSGADPSHLKLEITETAILGNLDEIANKLAELRELGIRISLDDFGTGYSSLAYLSRLPLDQLKIDRSFVSRLPEDGNDATVAQTIIGMGRGLNLEVIAEGVETQAQRDFLAAHGCDAFQGYLFSKPLPMAAFEALLQNISAKPELQLAHR